jgi:hypothetical protein
MRQTILAVLLPGHDGCDRGQLLHAAPARIHRFFRQVRQQIDGRAQEKRGHHRIPRPRRGGANASQGGRKGVNTGM